MNKILNTTLFNLFDHRRNNLTFKISLRFSKSLSKECTFSGLKNSSLLNVFLHSWSLRIWPVHKIMWGVSEFVCFRLLLKLIPNLVPLYPFWHLTSFPLFLLLLHNFLRISKSPFILPFLKSIIFTLFSFWLWTLSLNSHSWWF